MKTVIDVLKFLLKLIPLLLQVVRIIPTKKKEEEQPLEQPEEVEFPEVK